MKINERIRKIRESKNMTQTELAGLMNMSVQTYNGYELGRRKITTDTLEAIAEALNEPIANFFNNKIYDSKNERESKEAIS